MKTKMSTAERTEKMDERWEKWWETKQESSICPRYWYLIDKPIIEVPGRKKIIVHSEPYTAVEAHQVCSFRSGLSLGRHI